MASEYKTQVPPGVTARTHKRVTMRNVLENVRGQRYVVTHEAIDFVPVADVDRYEADARTRWEEVVVTAPNAAAPPVRRPDNTGRG